MRQFVESGMVGTRAEREAFENNLLVAWADADAHGVLVNPSQDAEPDIWIIGFNAMVQWGLLK